MKTKLFNKFSFKLLATCSVILIAGCGGSGGSSTSQPAPLPSTPPAGETPSTGETPTTGEIPDTLPDTMTFARKENVFPHSLQYSETLLIEGINRAVPITILNGEYKIDGGEYTSEPGMITAGQTLTLRQLTPAIINMEMETLLSVGEQEAVFITQTMPEIKNTSLFWHAAANPKDKIGIDYPEEVNNDGNITFADVNNDYYCNYSALIFKEFNSL